MLSLELERIQIFKSDRRYFAEHGVFYTDQQFENAGAEGDDFAGMSGQQAIARFGEFIRNFQEDRNTNVYPYA